MATAANPAYMSSRSFNDAFFSYDETSGLNPVVGATAEKCPAGRILRFNRRKLYPGVHNNVKTIMTGVYDKISQLSGFIDINSGIFTLYNLDLNDKDEGLDFNPRGKNQQGVKHKGQSVYTLGDVVAGGQFYTINTIDLGIGEYINGDFSEASYYTITVNQDTHLNATIVPKHKGTVIYITIYGDGLSTLYFDQNFENNLPSILTRSSSKIVVSFISDGITLMPISQSGPPSIFGRFAQIVKF